MIASAHSSFRTNCPDPDPPARPTADPVAGRMKSALWISKPALATPR